MTRNLFDELVGTPPPSTVDVRAIVRREKRRRTVLRSGGVAAAVVAVTAIALSGFWPGPAAPDGAAPVAGGSVPPAGIRLAANDRASAEASAAALRAALDEAVHRAEPGVRWVSQQVGSRRAAPDGEPPLLYGDDAIPKADQPFSGGTGLAVGGRRGTLTFEVAATLQCADTTNPKCAVENADPEQVRVQRAEWLLTCQPQVPDCVTSTTADGRRVLAQTHTGQRAETFQEARMELPDRRVLTLMVSNLFVTGGGQSVAQEATPLSRPQVAEIAQRVGGQIRP